MHIEIRMFRSFNFLGRKCLYQNQQNLQNGDILKIDSSPTISQTLLILHHLIIQNAVATFFLPKVCFCNCDLVSGMKTSSESSERHLQSPQFKTNIYIHSPCRQHYKKYTVPTNLWEQPIGNHHLVFPQPVLSHLLEHQVYCSDKFVGTANRKPPFAVPTIFVGTVGPTNLSEQPIGNQFSVPTILVGTALFPQRLWEHHVVPSFW